MRRSLAIFFIYVAVFLLLFAATVRGEEPKQKTTPAVTNTCRRNLRGGAALPFGRQASTPRITGSPKITYRFGFAQLNRRFSKFPIPLAVVRNRQVTVG